MSEEPEYIGKDNEKYLEEAMAYYRELPEMESKEEIEAKQKEEEPEFDDPLEIDVPQKQWNGVMDGYLRKNLNVAKQIIKKDWDMLFVIDGYEGSGKSCLAQQCAKEVDPTFCIERVCFNPKEFCKAIDKAKKFQCIVYDEAFTGMSSRAAMSEVNRMLMGVLAEIRQKNLWVFIVLPCFFELDKYAAVWRSRGLIHVYTGDNFKRGFFAFYNQNRKKDLYMLGKKYYSYFRPKPNFKGTFPKGYSIDEVEYRKKKLKALSDRENEEPDEKQREKMYRELAGGFGKMLIDRGLVTQAMLANKFNVSKPTISRLINMKKLDKIE